MNAVFDSNILIDYLNGDPKAAKEIARYQTRFISRITWMEILIGAHSENAQQVAESFFQLFTVSELTEVVASHAVEIRRKDRIRLPDAIILATARVNRCLLVTRNTKDFPPKKYPEVREPYKL